MAVFVSLGVPLSAQQAKVRRVTQVDMPSEVDSNSPAFWRDGQLNLLNSTGNGPMASSGSDQFHLGAPQAVFVNRINLWPTWMESVWTDPSGVVFGWYHQEHWGVCPGSRLAVPQIGAAISYDGGATFQDMGAVISSGDPYSCAAQNGYFAGGTGDFSVVLDRGHNYFYFYFSNYAGPVDTQGVAAARMPYSARFYPVGNVSKFYNGSWTEPGLRGRVTPIFPAKVSWMDANTDAFWGPSIHWNTYLGAWVMLLNHSCCSTGFPQEGIYISYANHLGGPAAWSQPTKLLDSTGWYPQVLGTGAAGTDTQAGRVARLYIWGHSYWEVIFEKPTPPPAGQ